MCRPSGAGLRSIPLHLVTRNLVLTHTLKAAPFDGGDYLARRYCLASGAAGASGLVAAPGAAAASCFACVSVWVAAVS